MKRYKFNQSNYLSFVLIVDSKNLRIQDIFKTISVQDLICKRFV